MSSSAGARPGKRIIVACDGTWLNSDSSFVRDSYWPWETRGHIVVPSNVTRICRSIKHSTSDGKPQITYYQAGIGTSGSVIDHVIQGATGAGLSENIRVAYSFICNNYAPGDEIILIGFSRGAFTARSIAALIYSVGLLTPHGLQYFYQIFKDWENHAIKGWQTPFKNEPWPDRPNITKPEYGQKLEELHLSRLNIPIKAVAVWDTVGSLGIPVIGMFPQPVSHEYSFVNTAVPRNVENAFHALALDEYRRPFIPTVWEHPPGQEKPYVLKQTWFPGVHSDIGGGGYKEEDQANLVLAWMISQLDPYIEFDQEYLFPPNGLNFGEIKSEGRDWGLGEIHNSHKGIYVFGGTTVRTPGQYMEKDPITLEPTRRRLHNTQETIHPSVRVRMSLNGLGYDNIGPYKCQALQGWKIDGVDTEGTGIRWIKKTGDKECPEIVLPEAELGDVEIELLKKQSPKTFEDLMKIAPRTHHG